MPRLFSSGEASDSAVRLIQMKPKYEIVPFKSELFGCEETPDDFVPPWEPPKKEVAAVEEKPPPPPPADFSTFSGSFTTTFSIADGPSACCTSSPPCMQCLRRSAKAKVGTGGPSAWIARRSSDNLRRAAQGHSGDLDSLVLRSSSKLKRGERVYPQMLRRQEKAVSAKFSAVSDMNRLQLEYSNHTHRSNERLRDTMAHNRAGLGRTLIGNMSHTSKFRDYTNTEMQKHNWDPFKVQTSDSS
jgi:hypothetical protein